MTDALLSDPRVIDALSKLRDAKRVRLKPGDVVVVRVTSEYVSSESLENMTEALSSVFPDNRTLVLGPKVDLEVVQQPPGDEAQ